MPSVESRPSHPGTKFWMRASVVALLVTSGACTEDLPGIATTSDEDSGTSTGDDPTTADPDATGTSTSGDSTRGPPDPTNTTVATDPTMGESTTGKSTTGEPTMGESSGSTGPDPVCGDGMIDAGEACDGADLGGEDCESQGFAGGELACLGDCSGFDSAACTTGSGDCCAAHGTTGCDDAGCEAAICGPDPFCCDTQWDDICANAALTNPACVDVGGSCPCQDEDIGGSTGPAVSLGNTGGDDDDIDASCGGSGGNDRVILFTAPADGSYTFDTFGSGYDTKLSLHFDCASEISCNDDAGGGLQSQLQLDMVAGQRVMVVVDGYDGATGDWVLNVSAAPVMPPVCGDAVVAAPEICDGPNLNGQTCLVQGYPGGGVLACSVDCLAFDPSGCLLGPFMCSDEDIGGMTGAAVSTGDTTGDDDDLNGSCGAAGGNDHVVTFTAPAAGMYTFDTFGSMYDTKLGLYADCMSELYCNDDAGGGLQSELAVNMGAGQAVLVVIDGYNGSTGAWVLNITQS